MSVLAWLDLGFAAHRSRAVGAPNPHKASGLEARVYTSVAEIPPSLWDACGGGLFLSREYLAALEAAPPANLRLLFVCLLDEGGPAAIAHLQVLRFDPDLQRQLGPRGSFHRHLHDVFTTHLYDSALICGNILLSGEHAYAMRPGVDERRVVQGLAEVAHGIRQREPNVGAVVMKDFRADTGDADAVLADYGFRAFDAGPGLVIPIRPEWTTFERYVASMKGKYRRRTEAVLKKGRALERRPLQADDLRARAADLQRLYEEVAGRADFRPFRLDAALFAELADRLGDRFTCDGWFDGDRLVAFTTRLFDGATVEGYAHGLAEADNRKWELYQHILLDDVREAIARGCTVVRTGRTSIGMKSAVGAVPDAMTCWLRASGIGANHLVPVALRMVRPANEPVRDPFSV